MIQTSISQTESTIERHHLRVTGVVQGVGFRPFVYGLAQRLGICGLVGNDSSGVFIEIEGTPQQLAEFAHRLREDAPPLAHIEAVTRSALSPQRETVFRIVESAHIASASTLISPDLCVCEDCLREMRDPSDRRYRYPFINCTHCGPRFTITRDLPYDRPLTTMAAFEMCPQCRAEYENPLDRRFHAQPIACPHCGPQLTYVCIQGASERETALQAARAALLRGEIVAVKGLGGFHLACDATNPAAVERLRERKGRREKPFAVMVTTLDQADTLAHINSAESALLTSRERPIVLLEKRAASPLADVAPGNPYIGIMLPYTPLHELLLENMPPLVMTSANYTEEPIVVDNTGALEKLAEIADGFLLHDRAIHTHCDDSVVRVVADHELPVRRSRGYAPFPVHLPFSVAPVLATGGELKATFCLTRDDHAFMSQHIGDMENLETLHAFERAADHMQRIFRIEPQAIICDAHPRYLSTHWAEKYSAAHNLPLRKVQHHHAHIAAVMAENQHNGEQPVIGFSFDGTGYGDDGTIWGGEILLADYRGYSRAAHLRYIPLAGGDISIRHPYRLALSYLWQAGIAWEASLPAVAACSPAEQKILLHQLAKNLNCVPTSSIGRLFDAVASLIGVRQIISYEAQAAIELEAIAETSAPYPYQFALLADDPLQIDPTPVLAAIVADLQAGVAVARIAGRFHLAVADLIAQLAVHIRTTTGLHTVALSGGVFQNVTLLGLALDRLQAHGFTTLTHRRVPPNDGGLALGQAIIGSVLAG